METPEPGLVSQIEFSRHLRHSIECAGRNPAYRFAVLVLELDQAGALPDGCHGRLDHRLLEEISRRLVGAVRRRSMRGRQDVVAGLRAGRFAILLANLRGEKDALLVAERILARIAEPLRLDGRHTCVSGSIGIAANPRTRESPFRILRDAHAALRRAQAFGGARYAVSGAPGEARTAVLAES